MNYEEFSEFEIKTNKKYYYYSFYNSIFIFFIIFIIFLFFNFLINIKPKINYNNNLLFSGFRALKHWEILAPNNKTREINTKFYNFTYSYIYSTLLNYSLNNNNNNNINISLKEQFGEIYPSKEEGIFHIQSDIRNILYFINKNNDLTPPLIISAHLDSKNSGPGAYDDCIGIAAMLELAYLYTQTPPRIPILLVFIGTEELGLAGSKLFIKNNISSSGFINIESLGPGKP